MKNYNQKSGMLMIMRAMIMTVIALVVCWIGYKTCRPRPVEPKIYFERDLSDVVFVTDKNDNLVGIR